MHLFNMLGGITDFFNSIPHYLSAAVNFIFILLYILFKAVCQVCYILERIFRAFAGIDTLYFGSTPVENKAGEDILFAFLRSNVVRSSFWIILGFSIVLLVVLTIIAVIKSEFTTDVAKAAKGPIIGRAFKGLLNFFLVPFIMIISVYGVNILTKTVYNLTGENTESSLIVTSCFEVGALDANRARNEKGFANFLSSGTFTKDQENNIFKDKQRAGVAEIIDECFWGDPTSKAEGKKYFDGEKFIIASYNYIDFSLEDLNTMQNNLDKEIEQKNKDSDKDPNYEYKNYAPWMQTLLERTPSNANSDQLPIFNVNLVNYYYDLGNFDFILAICSAVAIAWYMLCIAVGLIKRAFELVILYVISPAVVSMSPLDDGKALGGWRSEVLKRMLAAVAPVLAINLYFLIITPFVKQLSLFHAKASFSATLGTSQVMLGASTWIGGAILTKLADAFLQVLCLIVGLGLLKTANGWLSSFLGVYDIMAEGSGTMSKGAKAVATAGLITTGVAMAGVGAAKAVGSAVGKVGGAVGGAVKGTAQALRGGVRKYQEDHSYEATKLRENKSKIKDLDSRMEELKNNGLEKTEHYLMAKDARDKLMTENEGLEGKIKSGDVNSKRVLKKKAKLQKQQELNDIKISNWAHQVETAQTDSGKRFAYTQEEKLMDDQKRIKEQQKKLDEKDRAKFKHYAENGGGFKSSFNDVFIPKTVTDKTSKVLDKGKDLAKGAGEKLGGFAKGAGKRFENFMSSPAISNITQGLSQLYGGADSDAGKILSMFTRKGIKSLYQSSTTAKNIDKAKDKAKEANEHASILKQDEAAKAALEKERKDAEIAAKEQEALTLFAISQIDKQNGNGVLTEQYNEMLRKLVQAQKLGNKDLAQQITSEIAKFNDTNNIKTEVKKAEGDVINNTNDKGKEFEEFKKELDRKAREQAVNDAKSTLQGGEIDIKDESINRLSRGVADARGKMDIDEESINHLAQKTGREFKKVLEERQKRENKKAKENANLFAEQIGIKLGEKFDNVVSGLNSIKEILNKNNGENDNNSNS